MENYNDLHTFTLCRDDWQVVIDSLYEAASDRMSRASAIGLDSTYGNILYLDGHRVKAVADYLEFHLPEGPTDEQLIEAYQRSYQPAWERGEHYGCHIDGLRAILTRWGNHPGSPDSSTPPIPVSERLPGPEDCDAEGKCWWWYPPVPEQTYGYWAHEDDAVPERAVDEQPSHWLPANALSQPS